MKNERAGLSRRGFIQATAAAAALGSSVAKGGIPKEKQIPLTGIIPEKAFGSTGHVLPILAFGGCGVVQRWGMGYNAPVLPEDKRIAMVRRAFDQGVRYFDTARGYFESEAIMGQGLKPVRDQVYLATKIWAMKPEDVRPSVEASLKALDTDYADAMQIHGPIIERLDFDATMKIHAEMVKLRDEGLFRFIGLTNHVAFEKTHALIETGGFDQVMLAYGYCKGFHQMLSDRNVEWREMCIAEAHDRKMGLVLMKAFNGWVYNRRAGSMVQGYDEAKLKKLPGAALRWVLQEKRFDMYNLGISYPEHLDEDIAIFTGDTTLTTADRRLLADFTGKVYESSWAKNLKVV
tara:strand:+ start:14483 stop:15523 length:1041 start_codon:yes stop_codon:yes gene_type:complete